MFDLTGDVEYCAIIMPNLGPVKLSTQTSMKSQNKIRKSNVPQGAGVQRGLFSSEGSWSDIAAVARIAYFTSWISKSEDTSRFQKSD